MTGERLASTRSEASGVWGRPHVAKRYGFTADPESIAKLRDKTTAGIPYF